jgi:hypothetical protein
LVRPRLAGLAKGGERTEHHCIGAENHVDVGLGQQDGAHRCSTSSLVDRQRRDIGHDGDAWNFVQRIPFSGETRREKLN